MRSALAIATALIAASQAVAGDEFVNPQPVTIVGYQGHAMEPFISRDGSRRSGTQMHVGRCEEQGHMVPSPLAGEGQGEG